MNPKRILQWALAAGLMSAVLFTFGCSFILTREVKVTGKALLSGAPIAGHEGTLVDFDGMKQTLTRSDGSYELSGVVTGGDPYVVTFSHSGFQNRTVSGKIDLPKDSSTEIKLSIQDVTLTP